MFPLAVADLLVFELGELAEVVQQSVLFEFRQKLRLGGGIQTPYPIDHVAFAHSPSTRKRGLRGRG